MRESIENLLTAVFDNFGWFLLAMFIFLMAGGGCHIHYVETVEMPKAYEAWCKMGGNPNGLTFEEWRSLVRAGQRSSTTTVAPVVIPMR